MKLRAIVLLMLGLIGVLAILSLNFFRVGAQTAVTTCSQCHSPEGQQPVDAQAEWHMQHSFADLCQVCHGGNGAAADLSAAHLGVVCNPLSRPDQACAICHPDSLADYVAPYAALTGTAEPEVCAPGGTAAVASTTPEPSATAPIASPTPPSAGATIPGGAGTPEPTQASTQTPTQVATVLPASAAETGANPPAPPALSGWFKVLSFARGTLFQAAFIFFVIGMLFRLIQALRSGWRHTPATGKRATPGNIGVSFLKGLLVLPFIPWTTGMFRRNPVIYLAGGLFHLGLFGVILLSKTHMLAWKGVLGFGWPVLPKFVISWLAAVGILAMLVLLVHRLVNPVLRLISGPAEWLNWAFVFLPLLTGFVLARKLWFPYEAMFSIHMLWVDFLLVWIPLSRISHWMFYFFARAIHGVEFGKRSTPA